MSPKSKLLKCKCSPKGCTHWEVVMLPEHGIGRNGTLKCVTCGDEHAIRIDVNTTHHKLHVAEHEV